MTGARGAYIIVAAVARRRGPRAGGSCVSSAGAHAGVLSCPLSPSHQALSLSVSAVRCPVCCPGLCVYLC